PLLLGWLRYLGEHHGFYDAATGVSLMVLATIGLLTALLLTTAERLHALDARRQEALEALRQAKDTLEGERAYLMSSAQCLLWWANIYDTEHPLYLGWDLHF